MLSLNGFDSLDVLGLEAGRVVVPPAAVVPPLCATPVLPGEGDIWYPITAVPGPVGRRIGLPDATIPLPGPEEPFLWCNPPCLRFEKSIPLAGVRKDIETGIACLLRSHLLLGNPCVELGLLLYKA